MTDYKYAQQLLNSPHVEQSKKDEFEREITKVRMQKIKENPIEGNFDFEHLSKIHKAIFSDLYEHAGTLRPPTDDWWKSQKATVDDLYRAGIYRHQEELSLYRLYGAFAKAEHAIDIINKNSHLLTGKNYLKNLEKDDFIREFTEAFVKVNHAHPFLDGNGRSTRTMFEQLAQQAGYQFDPNHIEKSDWNRACLLSSTHFLIIPKINGVEGGAIPLENNINPLLDIMNKSLTKNL